MIRRGRVLIVDDDPGLLEALSDALHLRIPGIEVQTAESAHAALERLSSTEFDAVVADIKMPGMDGLDLLGRIRELSPDTPTLLITGHGEHDLAIQALRGGAHDYVQKPIDRNYFVGSLRHAIERRRLSRKLADNKQRLEKQSKELEKCLEDRTHELRELYQREALSRAELERTTAELEAAQLRRDELVSVIAHELAGPLTTLRGYAQLLARPTVPPLVRERAKSILLSETGRMERLVQDLVSDAELPGGLSLHLERCDLVAVAREQVEVATARSNRQRLVLDAPEHLETNCDSARIAQVFANLLDNALIYAPRGEVRMVLRREGRRAHITICDDGPGIPTESLGSIFQPRVRLDARRKRQPGNGKGLGLSIAREIIESHGGRIWAESGPGQGARFNIVLPVRPDGGARRSRRNGGVSGVDKLVSESAPSHKAHSSRRGR